MSLTTRDADPQIVAMRSRGFHERQQQLFSTSQRHSKGYPEYVLLTVRRPAVLDVFSEELIPGNRYTLLRLCWLAVGPAASTQRRLELVFVVSGLIVGRRRHERRGG